MLKFLLSGVVGIIIGATATYQFRPYLPANDLTTDLLQENFSKWYEFHIQGALTLPNHDVRDEDQSAFQIFQRSHLFSPSPDDIKAICFATLEDEYDPDNHKLQTRIYLKDDSARKMGKAITPAEGHTLSFELNHFIMMTMPLKSGSYDRYNSFRQFDSDDGAHAPFNRMADFEISIDTNRYEKISVMLGFVHYLSPETVPTGCTPAFDSSLIPDWNKGIAYKWDLLPVQEPGSSVSD